MRNLIVSVVSVVALSLVGCGTDNVGACNRWKEKVKCGTLNVDAVNCDLYKNTTCDISEYFDCLSGAYVCTNGQYDMSKMQNATACASKAVCQ